MMTTKNDKYIQILEDNPEFKEWLIGYYENIPKYYDRLEDMIFATDLESLEWIFNNLKKHFQEKDS